MAWLLVSMALFAGAPAQACSVPVFRYALEHWEADPCQAILFHRGPLSAEDQKLAEDLTPSGLAGTVRANIAYRSVDLDKDPPAALADLWRQANVAILPWLIVQPPTAARREVNLWSGPFTREIVDQLLQSPARREIARRLGTGGESGVWVLLESGKPAADAAAAELLETRLAYLGEHLELPKLEAEDIKNGLVSVGQDGLRLAFSMMRIARTDPAEQVFIRTLLGTETDLLNTTEPVVFPVFGRGRSLYALVGEGIKKETIDDAATFLIGKCSCQVKDQNPGVDLLLAADWDALLKEQSAPLPDLPTLSELTATAPVKVTVTPEKTAAPEASDAPRPDAPQSTAAPQANPPIAGIVGVALVLAGLFLWRRK